MILTQIFIYGFFISEEKSKIISDTLINELNNAQNNDYKAKIIEFMLSRQILYTNHEEKLYNRAMELINNENHNDRYLKANTLLECCINNILVHNHEEELYNLLHQFHDEIVNNNVLRHLFQIRSSDMYNLFENHGDFIENLYNDCVQMDAQIRRGQR